MDVNREANQTDRKPSKYLYIAAASALLGAVGMGMVLGWTAPAFDDMERGDSEPRLTSSEADKDTKTWIGSSMTLGALVGALSSGPIAQTFGRKRALIIYGFPFTFGWFLLFMARNVTVVIIGRVVTGLCAGLVSGTAPTYVVEISTDKIRGLLGTCFQVCVTIGILLVYVFGAFLTWNWLAFVSMIPGLLMTVLMIGMPETPIWLLTKSKNADFSKGSDAEKALSKLRHPTNDNEDELRELSALAKESQKSSGISVKQVKKREVYLPFSLAIGLMFFQQFSGINAVMFYATSIFKDSGSTLKPSIATIIVGIAQVIATIVASLLVDRLGRKILLIISGAGHSLSLCALGFYYFFQTSSGGENSWGWLPVVCLVVFIISFSVGFGPIPWLMIPELTPIYARSFISAIATGFNWMCAFLITKNFEWLQDFADKHGAFFIFTCFCLISIAFVIAFLPETKGKSLDEIQRIFTKEQQTNSSDRQTLKGTDTAPEKTEMQKI